LPTISVEKGELQASIPKWFRRGTTNDDLLEQQGVVYITTVDGTLFSNCRLITEVEYEVQLRGRVPTPLTALRTGPVQVESKESSLRNTSAPSVEVSSGKVSASSPVDSENYYLVPKNMCVKGGKLPPS